jgi:hypothetical protein
MGIMVRALFLSILALVVTPVCATPIEFSYRVQRDTVRVEFQDRGNFSFTASDGAKTIVKNNAIYLIVKQAGRPDNVILVSDRRVTKDTASQTPEMSKTVALRRKQQRALPAYAREKSPQLFTTTLKYADKLPPLVITTSIDPSLARTQHAMHETLTAMDMTMCGATVQSLIASWIPELTQKGHAILGASSDIEIVALPKPLSPRSTAELPSGQAVLDYRLPTPSPSPSQKP